MGYAFHEQVDMLSKCHDRGHVGESFEAFEVQFLSLVVLVNHDASYVSCSVVTRNRPESHMEMSR